MTAINAETAFRYALACSILCPREMVPKFGAVALKFMQMLDTETVDRVMGEVEEMNHKELKALIEQMDKEVRK